MRMIQNSFKVSMVALLSFVTIQSFGQTSYVKPYCLAQGMSEADHVLVESSNKINTTYALIIQDQPSFKILLDEIAEINCDIVSEIGTNKEIPSGDERIIRLNEIKAEIKEIIKNFNN